MALLMRLSGHQPAIKVRLAASSKWNEWPHERCSNSRGCVWAERTCEAAGGAALVLVKFSELAFVALECQICTALATAQPAQPSLRVSSSRVHRDRWGDAQTK